MHRRDIRFALGRVVSSLRSVAERTARRANITPFTSLALTVLLFAEPAHAHAGHGALHTTAGQISVAVLGLGGLAVLAGVGRLYTDDAVTIRGASVGTVLGGTLLASAVLLVWPVV
jgi:hypothetical protein